MNIIWKKLYYRVQSLFIFLQKKMMSSNLELHHSNYRIDLLRTLVPIKESMPSVEVFIDIGTNKGEFSKIIIDIYHPSLVICIEPNEKLNPEIASNCKESNSVIINKAISNSVGEMDFYFHTDSQMSSLFASDKNLIQRDFQEDDADAIIKKVIPVTTLNAVFEENKDQLSGKTIFLKIDTQGNELEVIKGGDKMLSKISYCLLEYMFQSPYEKQYPFEEIMQVMSSHGFSCFGPMHVSQRVTGEVGAVLFLFGKNGRPGSCPNN